MKAISSGFRGAANTQNDVGRMDPAAHLANMSLQFRLSPAQKADSKALLSAQQDPSSPSFRRWLTPEQYGARFGESADGIALVTSWLESHGLTVDRASRAGTRIYFSGSVAQVNGAFSTELHQYDVKGIRHFAPATPALVPADIGDRVIGLHGIDDFGPRAPKHKISPAPDYTLDAGPPDAGEPADIFHFLAPEDLAKIYDVPNLFSSSSTPLNGDGVDIAVAGLSYYNPSDIAAFRNRFGLPVSAVVDHLVPGSGDQFWDEDALVEASLDLEWTGAVAPHATIHFVYNGDSGNASFLDPVFYAIDENIAPIVSVSLSLCEDEGAAYFGITKAELTEGLLEVGDQASLEGITVVAASGDTGAAGCDPNDGPPSASGGLRVGFPQSIPSVTSVGGTSVNNDDSNWGFNDGIGGSVTLAGSPPFFPTDQAWNDTFFDPTNPAISSTGGGASDLFKKPVWQVGTPADGQRDTPDVALSAGGGNVPFLIDFSYTLADGADAATARAQGLSLVGGTSASTPAFAGMLAILNQALVQNGQLSKPGLGNINPQLYALQAAPGSTVFKDVTVGDNCVPCTAGTTDCPTVAAGACDAIGVYGFKAGTGYDQVTGLGTIDALNMVTAWETLLPTSITLTATPNPAQTHSTVTMKATIARSGTGPAMTGTVSYYDQNLDKVGGTPAVVATAGGGTATGTTVALPPGVDQVFAAYSGDSHYMGSFTLLTITVDDDAGTSTIGGGTPIIVVDAGVDAASLFDGGILPPPPDAGTDASIAPDASTIPDASTTDASTTHDASTTADASTHDASTTPDSSTSPDSSTGGDSGSIGDDSGATDDDDSGTITTGDDDDTSEDAGEDAGTALAEDSGAITNPSGDDASASVDAATSDSGGNGDTGDSSGCGCVVAGSGQSENESRGSAMGGVLLGLAAFVRRRRSQKRTEGIRKDARS